MYNETGRIVLAGKILQKKQKKARLQNVSSQKKERFLLILLPERQIIFIRLAKTKNEIWAFHSIKNITFLELIPEKL